ncbi:hypothetical protein HS088_TW19G00850 [Tripterygium wilfordii]|uniref:Xyloglucan endotransglucosylase/hydrolase n=2 Tax=Tripterygium wilfordii TaxID=458696 RepID=A0A7J7CAP1_TRIWF|nr:hypothetical protein HS088_TW19G00850 [Tripterygium wilfordii]
MFLAWRHADAAKEGEVSFNENYKVLWGSDHVQLLNQEKEVRLTLDPSSGAGIESKTMYGSGYFQMKIKLPEKNSIGAVTTFYLISHSNIHDEVDFEFLGNETTPYTLSTNIFINDGGGREQQFHLWFDPTKDFHSYSLLWNQHQIALFVDHVPIRVYKNKTILGAEYPTQPMYIDASLWHGDGWASGGKPIDWSQAPFNAYYKELSPIHACPLQDNTNTQHCHSSKFWWNGEKHWELNPQQQSSYEHVRKTYMFYDYCANNPTPLPEC